MFDEMPPKIRINRKTKFLSLCPGCKKPGYRERGALEPGALEPGALEPGALEPGALDIPLGKSRCRSCAMLGRKNRGDGRSNLPGYEIEAEDGSVLVRQEDGKFKSKHRIVMEEVLGRKLEPGELVRFRDQNKKNLDPKNLFIENRAGNWVRKNNDPGAKVTIFGEGSMSLQKSDPS